ncbi:hypothetical protein BaRGS_00008091, partial [Batillaria attramentaria]
LTQITVTDAGVPKPFVSAQSFDVAGIDGRGEGLYRRHHGDLLNPAKVWAGSIRVELMADVQGDAL